MPRGPRRLPSGTAQSANVSSRVSDAFQPSLCSGSEIEYPGVPFSTTTFEISSSPVRAVIVTPHVSSVPAFVMNIFEPFTTHEPSRQLGGRPGRAGVRAGVGLGQPEGGEPAAGGEVGEPAVLLLVRAEEEDRHRPERRVRRDRDRDGRVDPRQLLDRDRVRDGVPAGPLVPLGDRDPEQPELCHLAHQLDREAALAVELLRDRRDALAREGADGVADELVLGREVEIHAARMVVATDRRHARLISAMPDVSKRRRRWGKSGDARSGEAVGLRRQDRAGSSRSSPSLGDIAPLRISWRALTARLGRAHATSGPMARRSRRQRRRRRRLPPQRSIARYRRTPSGANTARIAIVQSTERRNGCSLGNESVEGRARDCRTARASPA